MTNTLNFSSNSKNINTFLFVSSPVPENVDTPIFAPFSSLYEQNPASRGIPITSTTDKELNIGEIKVQVWMNLVEILVLDKNEKPYYKKLDDWHKFIYLTRNKNQELTSVLGLSIDDVSGVTKSILIKAHILLHYF